MRITSWNVNGIRAAIKKGALDWVLGQAAQGRAIDVFCLQEVKAQREQLPDENREIPGYTSYWNSAKRPGYSGVAVYSRIEPLSVVYGLGDERFDDEGRVIRLHYPGLILYNIYFPNGGRGQDRVTYKLDFYACLLEQCDQFHADGERVVITGDFNTAHREIDLAHPEIQRENLRIFTGGTRLAGPLPGARVCRYLSHLVS